MKNITSNLIPVPEATDASWDDWEQATRWDQTTIPGILVEISFEPTTDRMPLELLPLEKY
jgi:hypothetical protein